MPPKLSVRDLRKTYGRVEAVRGVSFEVQDREILGLLGPNGAGKTTTLECLIGLRQPDAGEIEVCGLDARRRPRDVKQKIGAALQTTALQDKITPREALTLFGSFYAQRAAPEDLLERFSLVEKADATFDTLSEGQRQRLALALAFVNRPEIVFLDEPTAGLDPQARRELHNEIARTRQDGHTVLLTTHYIDEAEHLCDRVAIIDHGRIVALGSPHDLMARSKASQSVSLVTAQPIDGLKIEGVPGVVDVVVEGARARFKTTDINRTMPDLLKLLESRRLELTELHVRKASLEDVFIELTGSALRD
jgi:ABC-2 type transport system ATP-binding protein